MFDLKVSKYELLCERMVELIRREKELAQEKSELREELLAEAGGDRMEYGIQVRQCERQGSVDYTKLCSELGIAAETVERYRKPKESYWLVKTY